MTYLRNIFLCDLYVYCFSKHKGAIFQVRSTYVERHCSAESSEFSVQFPYTCLPGVVADCSLQCKIRDVNPYFLLVIVGDREAVSLQLLRKQMTSTDCQLLFLGVAGYL